MSSNSENPENSNNSTQNPVRKDIKELTFPDHFLAGFVIDPDNFRMYHSHKISLPFVPSPNSCN